jgi:hypothetical protein
VTDELLIREQLARIDAAHADIALKQEQLRQMKTADIDLKQEQLRQMKAYEPWKLFAVILTAVAIASGVFGGGIGWTLAHWPLSVPP